MPERFVQFQVISLGDGVHTIYALDLAGKLWVKVGGDTDQEQVWQEVE